MYVARGFVLGACWAQEQQTWVATRAPFLVKEQTQESRRMDASSKLWADRQGLAYACTVHLLHKLGPGPYRYRLQVPWLLITRVRLKLAGFNSHFSPT